MNRATESARGYHDRTAHSPESVRASGHRLVWDIQPSPFKIYADLPPIPLPRDLPALGMDTFAALSAPVAGTAPLDLGRLAALVFFSGGITRTKEYPGGGRQFFRAAPSTGALYQTEIYVVTADLVDLPAGVYHVSPGDFALRRLREGDFRGALAVAAADDGLAAAPATLIATAIYWRNTWKYQARGYRHLFWDSGSLLANLLAAAAALDVAARLVTGFVEREVNGLLGVDAEKEGALVLAALGRAGRAAGVAPAITSLAHRVIPLSSRDVDYPVLRDAYANSSLDSEAEVQDWREAVGGEISSTISGGPEMAPAMPPFRARPLDGLSTISGGPEMAPALPQSADTPLPAPSPTSGRSLGDTIARRGSTRQFSGEPISALELGNALYHATRGWAADVPAGFVHLFVNVHAVEGLAPGAYRYHREGHALTLLHAGDVREASAFLTLEQALGGAGSATVFFLADLTGVLARWGNRGYRVANLEAGLIGGRLYLAAYAQGFGATGLTFYDRPVVDFFSSEAAGLDAIFVTALGRSVRTRPSTLVPPPAAPRR
jgi:SagB-type dehydrogenase family enzyme